MSVLHGPESEGLSVELANVAQAAGNRLRAEVDGDGGAANTAAQALLEAATSAMSRGISLREITEAEAVGKAEVRDALRPGTLKLVERTARQLTTARVEHERSILRAVRLGLSTRQVAAAAGVTHGTIRAVATRLASEPPTEPTAGDMPEWSDEPGVGEPRGTSPEAGPEESPAADDD